MLRGFRLDEVNCIVFELLDPGVLFSLTFVIVAMNEHDGDSERD